MGIKLKAAAAAAAIVFVGAAAGAPQTSGPVATYWVSAATSSGFGAGMMGAGGRPPGMGAMMGMMMGRGMNPNAVTRTLTLQLGSRERPSGAPQAEHLIPAGLGMGPSLPLVTPTPSQPSETPYTPGTQSMQRPRGRMLIYWGCGEHAGPGQPIVFDFSTIGPNSPMPNLSGSVQVNPERPPSVETSATYGQWPNEQDSRPVPETGSLVGAHTVRGDYSPEMHFTLQPGQDFMPSLGLTNGGALASGAQRLTWTPLREATGYHLTMFGGNQRSGGSDVVFWSSSRVRPGLMGGGLMDYLPPREVARLIGVGAVLPPQTGECIVPAEVASAAPMGMVMMIAYGPEANFSYPPRPPSGAWRLQWTAKVRFKSTANLMLGMPNMGGGSEDEDQAGDQSQQPQQQQKRRRPSIFGLPGLPFPH